VISIGVSPRRKSSSTPLRANPLNRSTVARSEAAKSADRRVLRAPAPSLTSRSSSASASSSSGVA